MEEYTEMVNDGVFLVGLSKSDCKPINELKKAGI